jgi:hypothetical protein
MATCDPASLQNAARCFTCVPDGLKPAFNLSLLASILGDTRSPQALEAAASSFALLKGKGLELAAKAYLLAVLAGGSTDPKVLATLASQYVGYVRDPDSQSNVESYLWALMAGGSTTPGDLIPASVPYDRLRYDTWKIELYLLAGKAGITSAQAVVTGASCFFSCLGGGLVRDVIIYLLCSINNSGTFGLSFGCQTANAWAARVVTNGGSMPSANTVAAVCAFVDTLNNAGLWSQMVHVSVFAPDSITAAITPLLVGPGGNDPYPGVCGNNNVTTLGLTINGLKANVGNSAAENTGIAASNVFPSDTSAGITVVISEVSISEAAQDVGYIRSADNGANFAFYSHFGATTCFFLCWDGANGQCTGTYPGGGSSAAYFSGNRTAANLSSIYYANTGNAHQQIGTIATMGGTRQNAPAYLLDAFNITGPGCGTISTKRMSFAALHLGLSQAQSLILFNAVQAMRTSFGGGFV